MASVGTVPALVPGGARLKKMLFLFVGLIVASVLVVVVRTQSFASVHPLGFMSERWVAEHRAAEHL